MQSTNPETGTMEPKVPPPQICGSCPQHPHLPPSFLLLVHKKTRGSVPRLPGDPRMCPWPDSELDLNAAPPQTGPCPCLLVLIVRYETDNKQGIKSKQLDCAVPGSSWLGRAVPQGILPVLVPHLPPPPRQTWALLGWVGSSPYPTCLLSPLRMFPLTSLL